MSRTLAFVADLHMANHRAQGGPWESGLNTRGRLTVDVFGNALSLAEAHEVDRMIVLGDVFDTTKPTPQLIAAAQQMVNHHHGLEIRIIRGNHDMESTDLGDHALGPLGALRDVKVYEQPDLEILPGNPMVTFEQPGLDILYVPFEPGPAHEWLPMRVQGLMNSRSTEVVTARVLCIHLGIYDSTMLGGVDGQWISKAHDAVSLEQLAKICFQHRITAVFAGNWHSRRVWNVKEDKTGRRVTVVQAGTLCPTGWDNPGLEGYGSVTLVTFGNDGSLHNLTHPEVPGPRFVNVKSEEEAKAMAAFAKRTKCQLYVRWTSKPDTVASARSALGAMHAAGEIEAFDTPIDKSEVQLQARSAAEAAQSTTTMQAVLEAFVTKMPMPEGVSRENVFNRAKNYLEG